MEKITYEYYKDGAKKLHKIVDSILKRFGGISQKDYDDFYSLANEWFYLTGKEYEKDKSTDFQCILYSCLKRKILTEITRRNRLKRQQILIVDGNKVYVPTMSINVPIGDDEDSTLEDIIPDNHNYENEILEGTHEYSEKALKYLSRLSNLQRDVLQLTIAGFKASEIMESLHITPEEYSDCNSAIHSYRNVSVLF